ncbi:Uncharacterised protein [Chromobacterium violaceum]|uniref:Uncharacterized protein n=1 Tax=Chromobacterium violaceum TaxID=536 RepID=A0A447TAU9_CHRVL|nr:Uncharacterised protein [Chromobacterium violaceum]
MQELSLIQTLAVSILPVLFAITMPPAPRPSWPTGWATAPPT